MIIEFQWPCFSMLHLLCCISCPSASVAFSYLARDGLYWFSVASWLASKDS